jgi:hypothetical protein
MNRILIATDDSSAAEQAVDGSRARKGRRSTRHSRIRSSSN